MPKEEWGTKRICPTTGRPFYDLGASPIISPYTGEEVALDTGKTNRTMVADKADKASKVIEDDDDDVILDDDDDADVDLGDDVLDDDDDDDDVSLDDIADVSTDDDD